MNKPAFLPEWSPTGAVLLAWPYPQGDWRSNFSQVEHCYWDILTALTQYVDVWLLYHDSLSLLDFEATLAQRKINGERIKVFHLAYEDTWIRDYGPLSTSHGLIKYRFNGWGGKYPSVLDNQAVEHVLQKQDVAFKNVEFVCEGGALETDGEKLLMNSNCVVDAARNPNMHLLDIERQFAADFGDLQVIWLHDICLTGDDTDGHIDTIARFASPERIVYAGPNAQHSDAEALLRLQGQIEELASQHDWHAYALPTPEFVSAVDGRILPCTYANFLICNSVVFAPIYGIAEDDQALSVLQRAFADFKIIPVRCEALLEQHGSLHCATMQIAEQSLVAGGES